MIKKIGLLLISIGVFLTPFILIILPINYFDTGQTMCFSKQFLNLECLGCGITRGIQHLIHLDFIGSWELNKLSYIVLPVLIFLWLKETIKLKNVFLSKIKK